MGIIQFNRELILRGELSGWARVESDLGRRGRRDVSRLLVHRQTGQVEEIVLPISLAGQINRLVRLPGDVARLSWQLPEYRERDRLRLSIRPVGLVEGSLRMAYEVFRSRARLNRHDRDRSGLSLRRILVDLPGAYDIVKQLRGFFPYADWVKRFDILSAADCRYISRETEHMADPPRFHILLAANGSARESVEATLTSLREQLYGHFSCSVINIDGGVDCLSEFNKAIAEDGDAWVMLLQAGDVLPPHALYLFAREILAQLDAVIVYSDDDAIGADGKRRCPHFKPDWSLAHLRATHYLGEAVALRGSAVTAAGGVRAECCRHGVYDLLLRMIDATGERVRHVPAVLLHRRNEAREMIERRDRAQWEADALRQHLVRNGVAAAVAETIPRCRRILFRLPQALPWVTVVVPTRDAPSMISRCVEGLLHKTTYPQLEVIVVDNQSTDPEALRYLSGLAGHSAVRVVRYDRPFNFSAINNFAVAQARGTVICLLNNDTEVISPDWLEEMTGHLMQPHVGVVGAKLYYPDGRVQHGGDVVGPGGCANHLHSGIDGGDPGYCRRAVVAQELSAVTAACLISWRDLYRNLGGLDEKYLPVAFNDVDYCLRVREAGYRVVWTPHAELYHHESVSRGGDKSWRARLRARREVAIMRRRWGHIMKRDPFYNPNLSYDYPDFSPSRAPRVAKPWPAASRS